MAESECSAYLRPMLTTSTFGFIMLTTLLGLAGLAEGRLLKSAASAGSEWPNLQKGLSGGGPGSGDAALIVSLERYAYLDPVAGARENAEDWRNWLRRARGLKSENIVLLADIEVTPDRVLKRAQLVARTVRPGSTVWIVWIGHGMPSRDGEDAAFLTYDARTGDEALKDSIPREDLIRELKTGPQTRTVFVVDTCFAAGRDHGGQDLMPGAQPLLRVPPLKSSDVIFLTAGKSDEYAGPLPGASRPAFSYLVLGGLQGWADGATTGKRDGEVTVDEVTTFALKTLLQQDERRQTPTFAPESVGDVVLSTKARLATPDVSRIIRRSGLTLPPNAPSNGPPGTPKTARVSEVEDSRSNIEEVAPQFQPEPPENSVVLNEAERVDRSGSDESVRRTWGAACDAGEPIACVEYAIYLAAGDGGPTDRSEASKQVTEHIAKVLSLCEQGSQSACATSGAVLLHGIGVVADGSQGLENLRRACSRSNGRACRRLGNYFSSGNAVVQDENRAVENFRTACELKDMNGCARLGQLVLLGRGQRADPVRARTLLGLACDEGSALGCLVLAAATGSPQYGEPDTGTAARHLERSCTLGSFFACKKASEIHRDGEGVPINPPAAARFARRACTLNGQADCESQCHVAVPKTLYVDVPQSKPSGLPWDALDGPDLRVHCEGTAPLKAPSNAWQAAWTLPPSWSPLFPTTCTVIDSDLDSDDVVGSVVLQRAQAPGPAVMPDGRGLTVTLDWGCAQ